MAKQIEGQMTFEFDQRPTIKGFPELRWTGKRPYRSTQYYPAQLRESYGEPVDGWMNKIFWGDNLQVMSHMLKEYRGKIDLIYIDPPFDSKADYKKRIEIKKRGVVESDSTSFEEKQYGDIWANDEYLQFMYERLILMRELLSDSGSIFLHCDWHKSAFLRLIMDEVFGENNFRNEIVWSYKSAGMSTSTFPRKHDNIFYYSKTEDRIFNPIYIPHDEKVLKRFQRDEIGPYQLVNGKKYYANPQGKPIEDVWEILLANRDGQRTGYPTQKPEALIERIIQCATNKGDLVFDCFMGSGTTQAVAVKLGRRFIGADINLGSIQTTTKRLLKIAKEIRKIDKEVVGFEVYNVNNYDLFRNPVEAKELIMQALEIQSFPKTGVWDGELDGRMVKIMPVNRITTKADLEELKSNLPYRQYEKRKSENPNKPVEKITIVCMGHEPDLKGSLEQELSEYKFDIEIVDILKDKSDLQLKREAEAEVVREGNKLVIRAFYPMNLLQKLSMQKESVEEWRQLVESVMIDWNFDGVVMQPAVTDIPGKNEMVQGVYDIPKNAGTIKVKITDLLSESLEVEV